MLPRTLLKHASRNAIAYAALFIALGGSAYAAMTLPANSVGPKQLRVGAVTLPKIATKARAALHAIAPEAVSPSKFGTIPAARVNNGINSIAPNAKEHLVGFHQATFDNDQAFDSQGETLKAPISGIYQVDAGIEWASNGVGSRFVGLQVDSACCLAATWVPATTGTGPTIESTSDLLRLQAGQHVYVVGIQDSGSSLQIDNSQGTFLAMHWVSH